MKKNQLNKEEEILREKLNEVDFDFQSGDWAALEKQLPSSTGSAHWFSGKAAVAAAIVVSLTAAWFMIEGGQDEDVVKKEGKTELVNVSTEEQKADTSTVKNAEIAPQQSKAFKSEHLTEQNTARKADPLAAKEVTERRFDNTTEKSTTEETKLPLKAQMDNETPNEQIISEDTETTFEEAKINGLNSPDKVCEGGYYTIELDLENELPKGYTIDWYAEGILLAKDSRNSRMRLQDNGHNNHFKLIVKDPEGRVFRSYEKAIETTKLPELDFTYEDLKDPYQDFSAEVNVDPVIYSSYQWFDEDDHILAEGAKAEINFKKKGYYDLVLKAKTKDGCIKTLEKPLKIESDFDPLAPNAISPLNQDGKNDSFMPESFKNRDDQFKMQILTLDGRLIFETNSVFDEWNGKKNNIGQIMPAGQYVWKASISNASGKSRTFFGNLRIIP